MARRLRIGGLFFLFLVECGFLRWLCMGFSPRVRCRHGIILVTESRWEHSSKCRNSELQYEICIHHAFITHLSPLYYFTMDQLELKCAWCREDLFHHRSRDCTDYLSALETDFESTEQLWVRNNGKSSPVGLWTSLQKKYSNVCERNALSHYYYR